MDFRISLLKALKAGGVVVLGALATSLLSPEFQASLDQLARAIASEVPLVGGLVSPAIKSALVALVAGCVEGIRNVIKHWND